MSTRFVITTCCQAPVRLAFPNFQAECALVICVGCGREAGCPGAEDSPDVDQFLRAAPVQGMGQLISLAVYGDAEISHGRVISS